jgi:pilus assembly protein CpaE
MLSAAVACQDPKNAAHLRACLQQTGMVSSVKEWTLSPRGEWRLHASEPVPDVLLLGPHQDLEPYFALATRVRRIRPTVRIMVCSASGQAEPQPAVLLRAMRSGIQDFLPGPVDPGALTEILEGVIRESEHSGAVAADRLIVVLGAKGGVGTSTVAVNLAVQMAKLSAKKVGLIDCGRPVGHASLLLDLLPQFTVRDAVSSLDRLDAHFLKGLMLKHNSGVEVLAGPVHPEEWQQVAPASIERVARVAQTLYEQTVVDLGSYFSVEWMGLLRQARTVLLVAESSVPSLWAMERQTSALIALGMDTSKIRLVINRWTPRDEDALRSLEKALKRPVYVRLPNDYRQVREAVNQGLPLSRNHNNALVGEFRQLAARTLGVSPANQPPRRGSLLGLFSLSKAK